MRFFLVLLIYLLGMSFSVQNVFGIDNDPFRMPDGNYVVVGAFKFFANAEKFSDRIFSKGVVSKFGYCADQKFYYVYVNTAKEYSDARNHCLSLRKKPGFGDAWVLSVQEGNFMEYKNDQLSSSQNSAVVNVEPQTLIEKPLETSELIEEVIEEKIETVPQKVEDAAKVELEEGEYRLFFNVVDSRNLTAIPSKVQVVDPVRTKLISELGSNQPHVISDPNNGNNTLQFISNTMGYRKVQHEVKLDEPSESSNLVIQGDSLILNFELTRLKKGDMVIMYNVYFFSDAAVMRSESKFELQQLLDMMKENSDYKIVIHGHTNGNSSGKLIKMRDDDYDFFALSNRNKEGRGSAKELSKERANTIQRYLAYNGIDTKRMEIKGWGGKKMIYEKEDPNARKNVRVEIEIVED